MHLIMSRQTFKAWSQQKRFSQMELTRYPYVFISTWFMTATLVLRFSIRMANDRSVSRLIFFCIKNVLNFPIIKIILLQRFDAAIGISCNSQLGMYVLYITHELQKCIWVKNIHHRPFLIFYIISLNRMIHWKNIKTFKTESTCFGGNIRFSSIQIRFQKPRCIRSYFERIDLSSSF